MQAKVSSRRTILKTLESRLRRDLTYDSGRIIGSMCTRPHPFGKQVYARFLEKNLGDAGLFPGTARLEKETIRMLGSLLSNPDPSGHIVTGGTEANILAMWTAKRLSKRANCNIIVPASAHCSFDKAADLLGIGLSKARLNSKYQVDVADVKRLLDTNTVGIVGVAGTTSLGVVDPIEELSQLAVENGLYLHVDAAFGGFVLPFMKDLGYKTPDFDFALPGVCSVTVDPHKMGFAPIPSGGILFRNGNLKQAAAWSIPYLSGGESEQATIVGTRSGASVIAAWAVMKHLGREGYVNIIRRCMRLTLRLAKEIPKIKGMSTVAEPSMNVLGLKSDRFDIHRIAQELRHKGWAVSLFPGHIRVVVMPHVHEDHVEKFLGDLDHITNQLRG
jgi:tyrosine decarboxylase/aspartate 1-decarboxylase